MRIALFTLILAAGLAGCQLADPISVPFFPSDSAGEDARGGTITLTPFQPASPTARPTLTFPPPPTHTPAPSFTPSPTFTPTAQPCTEQSGRIEARQETFSSSGPFFFSIYLPPCFENNPGARYPVLYMIHGQTYSDDQWPRLGIGEAADALIRSGEAPPFIIVMPREANTFADIYQTPFRSDFVDGLIPWIDANFPTCAERACRAIGGLSRGGAWAMHLGFTRWELFGAIGMHSTPPFNTDPGLFPSWLQRIPADQRPRIYMDSGRGDAYLSMSSAFEEQLNRAGVAHEWYLFNGLHDEAYWSAHVADYLVWYTRPWREMFPEQ